jgi:uncharacterized protein YjbI with pentapeptide repeats
VNIEEKILYHASLIGTDFSMVDMSEVDLRGADLTNCNFDRAKLTGGIYKDCIFTNSSFRGADMDECDFTNAIMKKCDFSRANMRMSDFTDADLSGSDMTMSYGRSILFLRTRMWACAMRRVTYKNGFFIETDLQKSDFVGADLLGCRFDGANTLDVRNMDRATFFWYLNPYGGKPSYDPRPGWAKLDKSVLGGITFRENAAKGHGK